MMKKLPFIPLIFFLLSFSVAVFAQTAKKHNVTSGQTIYSISRQYGISQEELIKANPSLMNGLKAGDVLSIPASANAEATTPATTAYSGLHIVEAGETLYSIARLYQVSVSSLRELNPNAQSGIRAGQTLKIPMPGSSTPPPPAPAPSSNSAPTVATEQTPTQAATTAPATAPTPTPSVTQPAPATTPATATSKSTVKIALLLPFMLDKPQQQDATIDKFIEFYEGVLLGVSQMKDEGFSVELYTFDIEKNEEKTREVLLKNPALKTVDLIIGPAYSTQVNVVTAFAQENKIPVLVPFTSNIQGLAKNPYILQNNSSVATKNLAAAKLFTKKITDKNIIIMQFNNDPEDKGSEFARTLKVQLTKAGIPFQNLSFSQENFVSIPQLLTSDKETVLVLGTDKEALVKDLLPKLKAYHKKETPLAVFGFEEWGKTLKSYPATYHYTAFNINPKKKENAVYRAKFMQEFGFPTTAAPRFDLMGYDVSTYFIRLIKEKGKAFPSSLATFEQKPEHILQSRLKFVKINEKGGYTNEGLYIISKKEAGVLVFE